MERRQKWTRSTWPDGGRANVAAAAPASRWPRSTTPTWYVTRRTPMVRCCRSPSRSGRPSSRASRPVNSGSEAFIIRQAPAYRGLPRAERGILTQVRAIPHATDTGRFAVLHDAAESMLDDLHERYMVERRESKELLGAEEALVRMVRLIPRTPAAGPLAVAFTDFPGLMVRLGRWWAEALPACGCPECDEDPAELIGVLRGQVSALVEGGLWERVRRGVGGSWFETRLIGVGLSA